MVKPMTANNNLMIQIIAAPLAPSVNHSQPFGDKMFSIAPCA
jgi:hypothetical protein